MQRSLVTVLLVAVCQSIALAQFPASVKVSTSKLDGERQVSINPGWLKGGLQPPKLGGFWSDKTPTNFVLEAVLLGGGVPEKLKVGIDGRISEFAPTSTSPDVTHNGNAVESSRRFTVPLAFIEEMISGTNVVIQISDGRSFQEGGFSSDAPTRARPGFKKALQKIREPNEPVAPPKTKKSFSGRGR